MIIKILVQIIFPPFITKWVLTTFFAAKIGRHVKMSWLSIIAADTIILDDYCEIRPLTVIHLAGQVHIGSYAIVSMMNLIYGRASLSLGDHSYIGPQCLLNVDEDIRIGHHSALGARCMMFTHGSFFPYHRGYWVKFAPILIGNHSWLAGGVFVHPGISIGDHVFANSRAVIEQDIPSYSVVSGNPAKPLADIRKIQRKMNDGRLQSAIHDIIVNFHKQCLAGINITVNKTDSHFQYKSTDYKMQILNKLNDFKPMKKHNAKDILFIHDQDLQTVNLPNTTIWFDLVAMKTNQSNDIIHHQLRDFMKMYYGMSFEFYEK